MMQPYEAIRQRREEMAREVKQNRLGQGVAEVPQEGAGVSDRALAWEAKRIGDRLFKLIKASRDAD